jgi:hypothetical protein
VRPENSGLATVRGLAKGPTEAREADPVEPVEAAVVVASLPHVSPVMSATIRFQRLTGARPGDVYILRPCNVDRSSEVWAYVPESHKTEHHGWRRVIFIDPQVQRSFVNCLAAPACCAKATSVNGADCRNGW